MSELPIPHVRIAFPTDAALLGAFECSTGSWFEDDVERFIRQHALTVASLHAHWDHQLLLFLVDDDLVAVGAHEQIVMTDGDLGTHLVVIGISREHQGALLEGGVRLSDFVLDTLLRDALHPELREADTRLPRVHAVVAKENVRSRAFMERRGFDDDRDDDDPRYLHYYATVEP